MSNLALTMIVKDESEKLQRCLKSVKDQVDDMIIVDTGSIDDTREIALSFGARVFNFNWLDDFSAARNYALDQSKCEWNLILDADEFVLNDCKDSFTSFISGDSAIGRLRIVNKFRQGNEIKHSKSYVSRLFPKESRYSGRVHEQVESNLPRVNLPIEIFHDGYYETDKTERNLGLLMQDLIENPENPYILFQIAKQYKLMKRFEKADDYFERSYRKTSVSLLFRPSLVVDYLYNLMSLKKFKVGLEIIENEKEGLKNFPDFHFVTGLFYMEYIFNNDNEVQHYLHLIESAYLKCLDLGEVHFFESVIGTGSFLAAYNLASFYEVTGQIDKAKVYYTNSATHNYTPAVTRIKDLFQ